MNISEVTTALWKLGQYPAQQDVQEVVQSLTNEEISLVISRLETEQAEHQSRTTADVQGVMQAAEGDRAFGHGTSGLGTYYDEDVAAEHLGQRQMDKQYAQLIGCLNACKS
jgi:hypothetical protein